MGYENPTDVKIKIMTPKNCSRLLFLVLYLLLRYEGRHLLTKVYSELHLVRAPSSVALCQYIQDIFDEIFIIDISQAQLRQCQNKYAKNCIHWHKLNNPYRWMQSYGRKLTLSFLEMSQIHPWEWYPACHWNVNSSQNRKSLSWIHDSCWSLWVQYQGLSASHLWEGTWTNIKVRGTSWALYIVHTVASNRRRTCQSKTALYGSFKVRNQYI